LRHPDRLGGLDELEATRVEPLCAEHDRLNVVARSLERAADDLLGTAVAAHRVDRHANRAQAPPSIPGVPVRCHSAPPTAGAVPENRYGASEPSGSTSRPRYVLQFGHMRCESFG